MWALEWVYGPYPNIWGFVAHILTQEEQSQSIHEKYNNITIYLVCLYFFFVIKSIYLPNNFIHVLRKKEKTIRSCLFYRNYHGINYSWNNICDPNGYSQKEVDNIKFLVILYLLLFIFPTIAFIHILKKKEKTTRCCLFNRNFHGINYLRHLISIPVKQYLWFKRFLKEGGR